MWKDFSANLDLQLL